MKNKPSITCSKCGKAIDIEKFKESHKCNYFHMFLYEKWMGWPTLLIIAIACTIYEASTFDTLGLIIFFLITGVVSGIVQKAIDKYLRGR